MHVSSPLFARVGHEGQLLWLSIAAGIERKEKFPYGSLLIAVGQWQRLLPARTVVSFGVLDAVPEERLAKPARRLCTQDHGGLHHVKVRSKCGSSAANETRSKCTILTHP